MPEPDWMNNPRLKQQWNRKRDGYNRILSQGLTGIIENKRCKREACVIFEECDPDHKGYVTGKFGKLAACNEE